MMKRKSHTIRKNEKRKMKGTLGSGSSNTRHLQLQLSQVSLIALHHPTVSTSSAVPRFQNLLDAEAHDDPSTDDAAGGADDRDFILNHDFFCTPDYKTPDNQHLLNGFDFNKNMLRAKQIGTLSSSARSFFLSGSRCNAADGNSCTCTEDETCVSRRQQRKNEDLLVQKASSLVSKTTSRVDGTLVSRNSVNGPGSHKAKGVDQSGRVQQVRSASHPPSKSDSVTYACVVDGVQNHDTHSSPLDVDQFYRAGIAAVNFLSDLVNYKLPLSDGMGILSYSKNCMVDSARTLPNIRSSNVKQIRKEDFTSVHPKPPVSTHPGPSNHTSNYHGAKGKGDKSSLGKGFKHVASTGTKKSEVAANIPLNNHDRRPLPQRTRTQSNRFMTNFGSNVQTSSSQVLGSFKESFKI